MKFVENRNRLTDFENKLMVARGGVGEDFSKRPAVGLRGEGWALGQASLLEVGSLVETKRPRKQRRAELGLPSAAPC